MDLGLILRLTGTVDLGHCVLEGTLGSGAEYTVHTCSSPVTHKWIKSFYIQSIYNLGGSVDHGEWIKVLSPAFAYLKELLNI